MNVFSKSFHLWDNMGKYGRASQDIDDNMALGFEKLIWAIEICGLTPRPLYPRETDTVLIK